MFYNKKGHYTQTKAAQLRWLVHVVQVAGSRQAASSLLTQLSQVKKQASNTQKNFGLGFTFVKGKQRPKEV